MDRKQAEAAADALLAQARAARKPVRARRRPFTAGERGAIAALTVLGLVAGGVGAHVLRGSAGWAFSGAVWGVILGFAVGSLVIAVRRVLTNRSSPRDDSGA